MDILWKNAVLSFMLFWFYLLDHCRFELNQKVVLISLEHPDIYEVNHELGRVLNITSRRPGRSDRVHYIHFWVEYYKPLDHNSEILVHGHEFMSNEYKPTFVVLRFRFCDFLNAFLKSSNYYYSNGRVTPVPDSTYKKCYLKPGIYYFSNVSLPIVNLPMNFPFLKGRMFINHTFNSKQLLMAGYIDMELKTVPARKYKGQG